MTPTQTVYGVCKEVVAKAGIARDEIDFTAAGSADYLEGRPFSFGQALRYEGAWPLIHETHLEMDGAWAAYYAWLRLLTGKYDTALIHKLEQEQRGVPASRPEYHPRPLLRSGHWHRSYRPGGDAGQVLYGPLRHHLGAAGQGGGDKP